MCERGERWQKIPCFLRKRRAWNFVLLLDKVSEQWAIDARISRFDTSVLQVLSYFNRAIMCRLLPQSSKAFYRDMGSVQNFTGSCRQKKVSPWFRNEAVHLLFASFQIRTVRILISSISFLIVDILLVYQKNSSEAKALFHTSLVQVFGFRDSYRHLYFSDHVFEVSNSPLDRRFLQVYLLLDATGISLKMTTYFAQKWTCAWFS